ncbi:MAG: hypothetical protein K0R57_5103 [Paenibacillaceae bacterium]|jgi:hypothetical protein|nr:hypothetical protein [Paenibacillaceae bacterium]
MREGRIASFFNRTLFKKKTEEFQDNAQYNSIGNARSITCASCGAENVINSNSACEYCGSDLTYHSDDKTPPSAVAVNTGDGTEYILSTGFYTAGIDIPVGKCDVVAVSGSGVINTSDYSLGEIFGLEEDDVASFKGLKLPRGISLNVGGGLTVKLVFRSVESGFPGRTYDTARAIKLTTGNYEAGEDFKAGTYNIVAVSGSGSLFSGKANLGELFGVEMDDVHEIKHVCFPESAELSVEGGLVVKLVPAAL